MAEPVPQIARHLCRPTTRAASRRSGQRMSSNVNNQPQRSDIVNAVALAHGWSAFESAGTSGGIVTWAAPFYDTDSFWSAGSPTLVKIPLPGLYYISFQSTMFASAPVLAAAQVNLAATAGDGTAMNSWSYVTGADAAHQQTLLCSGVVRFKAGDHLSFNVFGGGLACFGQYAEVTFLGSM